MNAADGAKLAAVTAKISTVAIARAVLGAATQKLAAGYGEISNIPTTAIASFFGGGSGDDTQQAAKSLLDTVNNYAAKVYARLPTDDASQGSPVSLKDQAACGTVLAQAGDALAFIEKQIADLSFDFVGAMQAALEAVGGAIGKGVQAVTNAAASGLWAFIRAAWPTVLIILGIVAICLWARYRAMKKVLG